MQKMVVKYDKYVSVTTLHYLHHHHQIGGGSSECPSAELSCSFLRQF